MVCIHGHKTCTEIYYNIKKNPGPYRKGACIAILNDYNLGSKKGWVVLLGKENSGKSKDLYNIPGGHMDAEDGGCFIQTAIRELSEEVKIKLSFNDFGKKFKRHGRVQYIMHYGTPVFVGIFKHLSRKTLNPKIKSALLDSKLPSFQKEMYDVDWFLIHNKKHPQLEGVTASSKPVSSFAKSIMDKLMVDPSYF